MLKVLYNFLTIIFYVPFIFLILIRKSFNKEHETKFKEKFLKNKIKRPDGFLFWFHAASIGELNTIFPLLEFYLKQNPKYKFLITTITLTSFFELDKKYGNNQRVFHQFLPYDSSSLVENFLNNWKPNIVSFVDSEIWPNFFLKIKKANIPFFLLNARITKKTFKRWKIVKNFASELFSSITVSISSNKETIDYLKYFSAKNIKYFGNIKFCSSINQVNKEEIDQVNLESKKVWCALSTHPKEEELCAKVHQILKKTYKDLVTIIIPRHIHRTEKIKINLKKMGLTVQVKNQNNKIDESCEIILVNYYGSVLKYLNKFKQVFIGKSLLKKLEKDGGQNPIDAAKMGCYIFHGPYVSNFQEIYEYLDSKKISEKIENYNRLAERLNRNLKSNNEQSKLQEDRFKEFSSKIFDNTIKEYEIFIK